MTTTTRKMKPTSVSSSLTAFLRHHWTRRVTISVVLILMGLFMFFSGTANLNYTINSTLTFEPGQTEDVAHIVVPTLTFLQITSAVFILAGLLGIFAPVRLRRFTNGLLIVCGGLLFLAIMVAAAAGDRTNITTMLAESLRLATPIAIGAMAGIWCERSGIINIAIEGMMLIAACLGFATLYFLHPLMPGNVPLVLLISVIVAVIGGGIASLLLAWLSITFRTNQIVAGTVINILAVGITGFIRRQFLLSTQAGITRLPPVKIPILGDIPIIGSAFFDKQPIFYMMFVVIIVTHIVLFHTRWGLRLRACGEHPHAADTLGINVNRTRWINTFIGGLIAGLAGAWFSLEATGRFTDGMTRGAGFIALAAMIFGNWMPAGAFGGALLFGFSDALGTRFQALNVAVPNQFLQMVPYVVTVVVLAGLIGKVYAPKSEGIPYVKE